MVDSATQKLGEAGRKGRVRGARCENLSGKAGPVWPGGAAFTATMVVAYHKTPRGSTIRKSPFNILVIYSVSFIID